MSAEASQGWQTQAGFRHSWGRDEENLGWYHAHRAIFKTASVVDLDTDDGWDFAKSHPLVQALNATDTERGERQVERAMASAYDWWKYGQAEAVDATYFRIVASTAWASLSWQAQLTLRVIYALIRREGKSAIIAWEYVALALREWGLWPKASANHVGKAYQEIAATFPAELIFQHGVQEPSHSLPTKVAIAALEPAREVCDPSVLDIPDHVQDALDEYAGRKPRRPRARRENFIRESKRRLAWRKAQRAERAARRKEQGDGGAFVSATGKSLENSLARPAQTAGNSLEAGVLTSTPVGGSVALQTTEKAPAATSLDEPQPKKKRKRRRKFRSKCDDNLDAVVLTSQVLPDDELKALIQWNPPPSR